MHRTDKLLWLLGDHKLMCGDARSDADIARLMSGCRADMAFLDPPPGRAIDRGAASRCGLANASGSASADLVHLLGTTLAAAASVSREGAVHFVSMDWRHMAELMVAARPIYGAAIDVVVWVKSKPGEGTLYRSQHELFGVFRVGTTPPRADVERGRHRRPRSNVWRHSGCRVERLHPTAKPVALVADAIKDCTRSGDIILDSFAGTGTTVMAAERVGRHARALEIEPRLVDLAIRRWQACTRTDARHAESGLRFDEIAAHPSRHARPQDGG